MPPKPGSFGRVGNRKRSIQEMMRSQNTMIIDLTSSDPPSDDNEGPSPTYRLVRPTVSVSGEESTTSHSNESVETDSDTVSESQAIFSFGSDCNEINWRRRRKDKNHTIHWFWLLPQKQHRQEMDPPVSLPELPESDTIWDDSSWGLLISKSISKKRKQEMNKIATSSTKLTSSMHASTPVEYNRSKHRKVQGFVFATAEPFEGSRKRYNTASRKICAKIFNHDRKMPTQKFLLRIPLVPRFRNKRKVLSLGTRQSPSVNSPSFLYRWLRVQLESGSVLSAFAYLNRLLKSGYDDVVQVVENLQKDGAHPVEISSLESWKEKIAGIWCVYAHFLLEAGCLLLDRINEREYHFQENMSRVESELSFEDFFNLAISILWHLRNCPLVGDHASIGICLGRLIVSSTIPKHSMPNSFQVEISRKAMVENIQSAIDVCWDSIDLCRLCGNKMKRYSPKPLSKKFIQSLSKFELYFDETNNSAKHDREVVEIEILSTLLLPMNLRNSVPSGLCLSKEMSVDNRFHINSLCKELNRWSRLGEKLEVNAQYTVRLRAYDEPDVSFVVDELPLYMAIEILTDPLDSYKDIPSPGKEIIWNW